MSDKNAINPQVSNNLVKTIEYAVEVYDSHGFNRQIDVFNTNQEAENFVKRYDEKLDANEYLVITFIEYDDNENEIGIGTFWSSKDENTLNKEE